MKECNPKNQHNAMNKSQFFSQNHRNRQKLESSWLSSIIEYLRLLTKYLALSTLTLAAVPTLIVTTLPNFFAAAVNLLTPLFTILPVMAVAVASMALLLVGLKLTEHLINKVSSSNEQPLKNDAVSANSAVFS